jgi:hypothetical protein
MRRIIIAVLSIALLTATACGARGAAAGSGTHSAHSATAAVVDQPGQGNASSPPQAHAHQHPATAISAETRRLASLLAAGRLATTRYATSLDAAKAAGYQILTRMIPDMGWHFLNPAVQGFDIGKPPILVYERHGDTWQLAAFEWVFPTKPATPPLPGATYGSFGAACHYKDGTFVFAGTQDACPKRSPETDAAFNFRHPDLVTLHVWLWCPNPAGLYNGTNPYVTPFNRG